MARQRSTVCMSCCRTNRPTACGCGRHEGEQPNDAVDAGLVGEHGAEVVEADLRLADRRGLETHPEPGGLTGPDGSQKDFDRGVAASRAEIAQLTMQTAGRQFGIGRHALAQVGLERHDLTDARWPRCVGRWFETTLDVAADGLAIQARLPGNGGQTQAFQMQTPIIVTPKPDHSCSPRTAGGRAVDCRAAPHRADVSSAQQVGSFRSPDPGKLRAPFNLANSSEIFQDRFGTSRAFLLLGIQKV